MMCRRLLVGLPGDAYSPDSSRYPPRTHIELRHGFSHSGAVVSRGEYYPCLGRLDQTGQVGRPRSQSHKPDIRIMCISPRT